jgi:hypothetical protein
MPLSSNPPTNDRHEEVYQPGVNSFLIILWASILFRANGADVAGSRQRCRRRYEAMVLVARRQLKSRRALSEARVREIALSLRRGRV